MKPPLALLIALLLAPLTKLHSSDRPAGRDGLPPPPPAPLMRDAQFEACPPGILPSAAGTDAIWEIQRKGRPAIQDRLVVACIDDEWKAKSGRKCLALSIPQDTAGFEFVTVGQRLRLAAGQEYAASVWVRWTGGPDQAPADANAASAHPSAIVSFWARHRNGKGDFAGRDVWLFDNRWQRLEFRFCETDPDQPTLVYVSLLPNQKPAATTVLVDDFELTARDAPAESEPRSGNLVEDSGFHAQQPGAIGLPWSFARRGGSTVSAAVRNPGAKPCITLAMQEGTSNFESGQLWQHLDLRRGVRYDIRCRLRWDNFAPDLPAPIVNYGIYHEASRTWYGPVDQILDKSAGWSTYRFAHIPPFGGRWKLYVQLNGWGNFGHPVAVSLEDFTCTPAQDPSPSPSP